MRTAEAVAGMLCPVCRVSLAMSDRQGVEIDYCPQCRGVWLDRGELDKIIDRAAAADVAPAAAPAAAAPPAAPQPWGGGMGGGAMGAPGWGGGRDPHPDRHRDPRYAGKKRRKSFLEELFD